MDDVVKKRTFIWDKEYTVQYDMLARKHSPEMMERALLGVFWGIATNPQKYERVTPKIYQAKSRPLGLAVPGFKVRFTMGDTENEIVLLWIEESES